MDKPYSEMTPAERVASRIAKNRLIAEKIAEHKVVKKPSKPPVTSTPEFIRATPDEHAKLGGVIRKLTR